MTHSDLSSKVVVALAAAVLMGTAATLANVHGTSRRNSNEANASTVALPIVLEVDELALIPVDRRAPFPIDSIPANIRKLHNRRVYIRGYMYPPITESGITHFFLNGETQGKAVHFAADLIHAPLHYYIPVELKEGHSVDWSRRPLIIEGRFRIVPQVDDGVLESLFRIEDATATPTEPRKGYRSAVGFGC